MADNIKLSQLVMEKILGARQVEMAMEQELHRAKKVTQDLVQVVLDSHGVSADSSIDLQKGEIILKEPAGKPAADAPKVDVPVNQ